MVRISTRYDKDINKKVFIVRGDEAYARSTDATITLGSITTGNLNGLKIASITVDLYGTLGKGAVTLYDGDDSLVGYSRDIGSSTHQVTFSNIYLPYGVAHDLYVKYVPIDKLCLPCKSNKESVYEAIPPSLKINITKSSGNTQFNTDSAVTGTFAIKVGTNNAPNDTNIKLYIDGEYDSTLHPSSGVLSLSKSGLIDGKHNIRFVVDDTSSYWGGEYEYNVYVGYVVDIIEYPQEYVSDSIIKATVYTHNGNPVTQSGLELYISSPSTLIDTSTTNNDGVATFSNFGEGGSNDYYVDYNGSVSDTVHINVPIIENITITTTPSVIAKDKSSTISVSTHTNLDNIPILISMYDENSTMYSFPFRREKLHTKSGSATTTYTGTGAGNILIEAECSEVSDELYLKDAYVYWYSNSNKGGRLWHRTGGTADSLMEYNSYVQLSSKSKSGTSTFCMLDSMILSSSYAPKSFKFKIAKNPDNITTLKVGADGSTYDESNLIFVPLGDNPKGKTIEIRLDDDYIDVLVDDEVFASRQIEYFNEFVYGKYAKFPIIGFDSADGKVSRLYMNDIEYWRV